LPFSILLEKFQTPEILKILASVLAIAGFASFRSLELIPSGPGDLEILRLDKISETSEPSVLIEEKGNMAG